MATVYVARDESGKIVSVALTPASNMDPPITEEIDSKDPEFQQYVEGEKTAGRMHPNVNFDI